VTFELGRSLVLSGVISQEQLALALHAAVTQGVPLARALIGTGSLDEARLEEELARVDAPTIGEAVLVPELMDLLPLGLCHRLAAGPVRFDAATDTVDVAVLDPRDVHAANEIAYHLKKAVRVLRAPYGTLRQMLEGYPAGLRALAPPMGSASGGDRPFLRTPVWGTPKLVASEPPSADMPIPLTRKYDGMSATLRGRARDEADEVPVLTRTWDGADAYGAAGSVEASWDAEPVFELRRLGAPATVPEPEPLTVPVRDQDGPSFVLKAPLPPRVPLAPNAPQLPFADLGAILASIRAASDRDAVLGLVQLGLRSVARRVAILVVKKDGLAGWSCTPEFGDQGALKALRIPIQGANTAAVIGGGVHLGPLTGLLSAPLLRIMRSTTQDVAILAVRVGDRPAVLLVADELGDTLLATKRMDELARAAGEALLRILRGKNH
jgi:hypothetical protein